MTCANLLFLESPCEDYPLARSYMPSSAGAYHYEKITYIHGIALPVDANVNCPFLWVGVSSLARLRLRTYRVPETWQDPLGRHSPRALSRAEISSWFEFSILSKNDFVSLEKWISATVYETRHEENRLTSWNTANIVLFVLFNIVSLCNSGSGPGNCGRAGNIRVTSRKYLVFSLNFVRRSNSGRRKILTQESPKILQIRDLKLLRKNRKVTKNQVSVDFILKCL